MLADLARVAAEAGDLDRAGTLAGQAVTAARAITDPGWQAQVLGDVARAAAEAGDLDRAEAAARAITDPDRQARVLADLARAAARAGDLDRAGALAGRAEAAAQAITDPGWQAEVLADLARAARRVTWTGPRRWPPGRGGCLGDHRPRLAGAGAGDVARAGGGR